MKAKLIKKEGGYCLIIPGESTNKFIATIDGMYVDHILSLKNCEAIENGYDLMKLAEENSHKYYDVKTTDWHCNYNGFFSGFQKALELIGDKKFSEEDIIKAYNTNHPTPESKDFNRESFIQSLKQTEWDVEVVMLNGFDDINDPKPFSVPKLDKNGCLILKRK